MGNDVLVLWDIDGTLLNAGGVGHDRYDAVFRQLFGRPPAPPASAPGVSVPGVSVPAPAAGRTDRAIILDLLVRAGIAEPRRHVDHFIAGLGAQAQAVQATVAARGRVLPGAAEVLAAVARLRSRGPAISLGPLTGLRPTAARAGRMLASVAQPGGAASGGSWPALAALDLAAPGSAVPGRSVPGGVAVPAPRLAGGRLAAPRRVYQSVLTRNIRPVAEMQLAALGLRDGLDLCIGAYGDDHEDAAELVHVARRRAAGVHGRTAAAFEGAATVVVGATPLDVSAALAAGARAVAVASGGYPADVLAAAGARVVLPDLTDTGAVLEEILG
jgi:phosphoglycolate phosphatase-like HAD superfamily hydrolase